MFPYKLPLKIDLTDLAILDSNGIVVIPSVLYRADRKHYEDQKMALEAILMASNEVLQRPPKEINEKTVVAAKKGKN